MTSDLGFEGLGRVCQAEEAGKSTQERGGLGVDHGAVREAESCWVRCLQRRRGRQRCSQEMSGLWRPKAGICPLRSGSCVLQAHGSFSFSPSRQVICFRERKEEILDIEVKKNE